MKIALVAVDSKTGRTLQMARWIAEGLRREGIQTDLKSISEIGKEDELSGYHGYIFGCPTYFEDMTAEMKAFLFMVRQAGLEGKIGGAFGSYAHFGNAPKKINDTMEFIFRMNMAETGPFNVKEHVVDSEKGKDACIGYGQAMGRKIRELSAPESR